MLLKKKTLEADSAEAFYSDSSNIYAKHGLDIFLNEGK